MPEPAALLPNGAPAKVAAGGSMKLAARLLVLGMLATAGEAHAASCDSGPSGKLLTRMLDAGSRRGYNEALQDHGPVLASELRCVLDATDSWFASTRRNAATTLLLVHGNQPNDPKVLREAWVAVATRTSDVAVWAILAGKLLEHPESADQLALNRRRQIDRALDYTNADDPDFEQSVQAAGLQAGVWAKLPGLADEVLKRIDSGNAELRTVALEAMTPELAQAQTPRLLALLARYEADGLPGKQSSEDMFVALIGALIRSGDPRGVQAAHDALAKGFVSTKFTTSSRRELMAYRNIRFIYPDAATDRYLLGLMRTGDVLAPTAADILATQVWANHVPPRVELLEACVGAMERRPRTNELWLACDTAKDVLFAGKDPLTARQDPKQDPKVVARLAPLAASWRRDCADMEVGDACADMLYAMETGGNPRTRFEKGSPKSKSTQLDYAKSWLAACAEQKGCLP
jgi:hypothetical protein